MSADQVTKANMTLEEKTAQQRQDEAAAVAFLGHRLLESTTPEQRTITLELLRAMSTASVEPLMGKIEHDGHGNPLYTYGARMVWSKAAEQQELAALLAHQLTRAIDLAQAESHDHARP